MKILIEESVLRQAIEALQILGHGGNTRSGQAITALRTALDAAEKVEPDYFGLTEDNTWISCTKRIYDALKPEARMACYAAPTPPTNFDPKFPFGPEVFIEPPTNTDSELREAARAAVEWYFNPDDLNWGTEIMERLKEAL